MDNVGKQCIPSLELGDLSERKMQAVSRIPAVFLTTKNSHFMEPLGPSPLTPPLRGTIDAAKTTRSQSSCQPRLVGKRDSHRLFAVKLARIWPSCFLGEGCREF